MPKALWCKRRVCFRLLPVIGIFFVENLKNNKVRKLTEYELEDILTSTTLASVESFGMYITVVASYLVVAYLAGNKLTSQQTFIVSVLFSIAALLTTWSAYNYLGRSIPFADALEALNPGRRYGAQPYTQYWMTALLLAGICAALKFMWDIRHPKPE